MTETIQLLGKQVTFAKTIAESDVYLFAGITGDLSPYHVNEEMMRESQFGGRIVHGVLTLGLLSTASTLFWSTYGAAGQGVSLGYDRVRFVAPAFLGDTLTATYELTDYDSERRRFSAAGTVVNQHDKVCLVATHITKSFEKSESVAEPSKR